jgi:hypothetical protein
MYKEKRGRKLAAPDSEPGKLLETPWDVTTVH